MEKAIDDCAVVFTVAIVFFFIVIERWKEEEEKEQTSAMIGITNFRSQRAPTLRMKTERQREANESRLKSVDGELRGVP